MQREELLHAVCSLPLQGNIQQIFLYHQSLIDGCMSHNLKKKKSNASSSIIALRAGLTKNRLNFRAQSFRLKSGKTRWTFLMGSNWTRSWRERSREHHGKVWGFLRRWNARSLWILQVSSPTSRTSLQRRRTTFGSASEWIFLSRKVTSTYWL